MTREVFKVKINWLLDFYGTSMTELQFQMWYEIFGGITSEEFQEAVKHHIKNDHFNTFPAPGKINAALESLEEQRRNKPSEYPDFFVMWLAIVKWFPMQQNYAHFPPESDVAAWRRLYNDKDVGVVMIPDSMRKEAVARAIRWLEEEYA